MTRIIYLDIDGTLRDEEKGIPRSAVRALEACRAEGIWTVICTGRNLGSIQDDVRTLFTDGMISGGGCYIRLNGEDLREQHFSEEALAKAVSLAKELSLSLAVETKMGVYMDHGASTFYQEDFQHKIGGSSRQRQKVLLEQNRISYEENLSELWNGDEKVHKICMLGRRDQIDRAETGMSRDAEVIQKREWSGRWYLELLPKGCDKGEAVSWLNRRLGIPKRDSMSFGDGENDIAMMEATGIAVAMGGSNPVVKKYASSVCEPVFQDGIYKELVRRSMIRPTAWDGSD